MKLFICKSRDLRLCSIFLVLLVDHRSIWASCLDYAADFGAYTAKGCLIKELFEVECIGLADVFEVPNIVASMTRIAIHESTNML